MISFQVYYCRASAFISNYFDVCLLIVSETLTMHCVKFNSHLNLQRTSISKSAVKFSYVRHVYQSREFDANSAQKIGLSLEFSVIIYLPDTSSRFSPLRRNLLINIRDNNKTLLRVYPEITRSVIRKQLQ